MNNIYKVIWSKAKNCYVVASEIARSHTKSATGSKKIGGVTRRSLLASLMALSLLCGGLGVASAADGTVNVDESTPGTAVVYTKEGTESYVQGELSHYAKASDTFTKSQTFTQDQVRKLINDLKTGDVATNRADITALQSELGNKADESTVATALDGKANKADVYSRTEVDTAVANAVTTAGTNVDNKLTDYYNKAAVDGKIADEENARNNAITTAIGQERDARNTAITTAINGEVSERNQAIHTAITQEVTNRDAAVTNAKTELQGKITEEETARKEADTAFNTRLTTAEGKIGANETAIGDLKAADTALEGKITKNREDIATLNGKVATAEGNITDLKAKDIDLEGKIQTNANNIQTNKNDITSIKQRTAGIGRIDARHETTIEGHVTVDDHGNVTAEGKLKGESVDAGAVNAGSLQVDNASHLKGEVTMDKTLSVTGDTSLKKTDVDGALNAKDNVILGTNAANTVTVNGKSDFKAAVEMDKGLTVTNGETKLKKTTVEGDLKVTGTITTDKMVFGDKATNNYTEIDKGHITSKNDVLAGDATKKSSSMELDHSKLEVGVADKDSNGHLTMTADQTSIKNSDLDEKNYSEIVADKDSVTTTVKDEKGNTTSTKSSATEIRNYAKDKDGNKTINAQSATQNKSWAKDKDGNESSIVQTGKDITNTAEKGTITSKAKDIVNDASGNISNKSQTMDTTVTGKATESYGSLDTTVKGNETHIVKGTKTETVDGKVTENYKAGQETNVTGDQDIKVSGTQTTTATDINRNASSGMIDTVENAFGSNTETKVAGQTTTDVKLASGEEGHYIRGATESRDYLLNGALKNSETKTAEATSSEITDGTNTASTRQDAKNLAGSVTNGTETGISGIHANADGSVSIDSAVSGEGGSSVINQKKDSITSAVGNANGSISTVIRQDKDNVTIASSNGAVAIVGKDIVSNAQETITNTAGTSITNQVKDSKVTTDVDGTTFENKTAAVSDGGTTTTKINGNHINTGRVDANELDVSDKDEHGNTADLSVEAGKGVNASAGNGTTTGSLDVTAEEVSSSVKDASGKGSTFKQRIDKIMMESKDVSIKAEETLTNEAKVITNKASEVINNEAVNINNTATGIITSKASEIKNQADKLISNKVGENTWENMEDGKITTSIKDGAKQNLIQSDAAGTTQSTVDGGKSTVTIQNADGLADAVTNGTNTSVQNQTASAIAAAVKDGAGNENASVANATTSANTIKSGSKANTVISTADGTSFINSEAAAPVGDGTAVNTTIKGNTITTGKVTMDYAEVMKDLGVHGNAKVDQNLEVGGTSTLKGDVTMESNATVKKDLKVEGTTTTQTLKVTENAEIDGTLKVAKEATFEDSVSIAKDLSVGGDVTANSYKVGDKTYIDANGIHANGQKITDVADGSISEGSKDAVNGGQLYGVKRDLEHQVDKVGANAAAMANLRPMEFDPSSKWNIAAAIGNYGSETAAALGAFYRPNDDVMVNLSTAFGTGENMVGGGVSVRLGKSGNKLSREENNALKAQVDDLTARMDALLSVLNPNMSKDFPDVPENHWAYEAVSRLAGNDIVQGYPDGEFHGERTMTRYEMAEIIYNALSRGAEAEKELVEEFKPELQAMAASEKATAEKAEG